MGIDLHGITWPSRSKVKWLQWVRGQICKLVHFSSKLPGVLYLISKVSGTHICDDSSRNNTFIVIILSWHYIHIKCHLIIQNTHHFYHYILYNQYKRTMCSCFDLFFSASYFSELYILRTSRHQQWAHVHRSIWQSMLCIQSNKLTIKSYLDIFSDFKNHVFSCPN